VSKAVAAEFRSKFPHRPGQFTIDQLGLGGWEKVQKRFFDPSTGIMARIERQIGGTTG
jgi:ABC-type sulfate transport system substrate-binding protein